MHTIPRAIACYAVSSTIVVASVCASAKRAHPTESLLSGFVRFDARRFVNIVDSGYAFVPHGPSNVAFFPAYPSIAHCLTRLSTLNPALVLLAISQFSLLCAFVVSHAYLRLRRERGLDPKCGQDASRPGQSWHIADTYSLWAFALWPTTFFLRLPYTEALFLLVMVLAMYAMEAAWPVSAIAAIVGLATAIRPVGVAIVAPFAFYAIDHLERRSKRLLHLMWIIPLANWGLLAYMAFLQSRFGDPFAFARTQVYWRMRPFDSACDKALALCSLQPFWSVYVPGSPGYFGGFANLDNVFGQMRFSNPLFFGAAIALTLVGVYKRWVSPRETALACFLLAIPYITRSHEMCMESHGRFAAVVFPVYIVMGELLARAPRVTALCFLGICALALAWFSAGYARGQPFF